MKDAFGQKISESDAAITHLYGYTGREYNEVTKLQYNRARYYDPKLGRWINDDPKGFDAGDANLYRYVGNGPTNGTDPSGLESKSKDNTSTSSYFGWANYLSPLSGVGAVAYVIRGEYAKYEQVGRVTRTLVDGKPVEAAMQSTSFVLSAADPIVSPLPLQLVAPFVGGTPVSKAAKSLDEDSAVLGNYYSEGVQIALDFVNPATPVVRAVAKSTKDLLKNAVKIVSSFTDKVSAALKSGARSVTKKAIQVDVPSINVAEHANDVAPEMRAIADGKRVPPNTIHPALGNPNRVLSETDLNVPRLPRRYGPEAGELAPANWGKHITDETGVRPAAGMERPHGHHINMKAGQGSQVEFVENGKDILEFYDIPWYRGTGPTGNLVHAPNVSGQHTTENARKLYNELLEVHRSNVEAGLTWNEGREMITEQLQDAGRRMSRLEF